MEVTTTDTLNPLLARTTLLFVQVRNERKPWKILIDIREVIVLKSHAMTTNEIVSINTHGLHVRQVYVIR